MMSNFGKTNTPWSQLSGVNQKTNHSIHVCLKGGFKVWSYCFLAIWVFECNITLNMCGLGNPLGAASPI